MSELAVELGETTERFRILIEVDRLIEEVEDNPLFDGKERQLMLSAYRNVRRIVKAGEAK